MDALGVTNGQFIVKQDDTALGDTITFEILSYQDSWLCAPGDDTADKELVKYSDDGITAKDGTDLREHLEALKGMGFKNAAISQRLTLVGGMVKCDKKPELVDTPFQISLPPTSRVAFNRYMLTADFRIRKGLMSPEAAKTVKATVTLAKSGNNRFSVVNFSAA